jgi:hypothetical protein
MFPTKFKAPILVLLGAIILVPGYGAILTPAAGQSAAPGASDKKPQPKVKWEYKALTDPDIEKLAPEGSQDKLTDGLNKLGDKGWELVTVVPGGRGGAFRIGVGGPGGPGGPPGGPGAGMAAPHLTYVFKRPK